MAGHQGVLQPGELRQSLTSDPRNQLIGKFGTCLMSRTSPPSKLPAPLHGAHPSVSPTEADRGSLPSSVKIPTSGVDTVGSVHYWNICLPVIEGRARHLYKCTPKMSGWVWFLKKLKRGHYHHEAHLRASRDDGRHCGSRASSAAGH